METGGWKRVFILRRAFPEMARLESFYTSPENNVRTYLKIVAVIVVAGMAEKSLLAFSALRHLGGRVQALQEQKYRLIRR